MNTVQPQDEPTPNEPARGIDITKKSLIEIQIISRSLNTARVSACNAAEEFRLAVMIDAPETRESLLDNMVRELENVADAIRRVRGTLEIRPRKRPALVSEQAR